jgi:predicted porin
VTTKPKEETTMKRTLLCISLSLITAAAAAQSTVSISGDLKLTMAHGNGGTTPIDGQTRKGWSMNDLSSALIFSGKEDLGGGLRAGFELASFLRVDDGTTWASTGGPFFSRRSVLTLGGSFGELYFGRSLTPQQLMVLFSDPWYWDGSAAQIGWQVQTANYTSTSYIRTNNTVGYVSPNINGFTLTLAAAPGEGAHSRDIGGSLTYSNGPLWAGFAYDQSHGFFNDPTQNHVSTLVGAYDFGVVRPLVSYTSSSVNGVSYKGLSLGVTAPVGDRGQFKAQVSHLDDVDTSTVAREGLSKLGLGYTYSLSKRSSLFGHFSRAKSEGSSATTTLEFGMEHAF